MEAYRKIRATTDPDKALPHFCRFNVTSCRKEWESGYGQRFPPINCMCFRAFLLLFLSLVSSCRVQVDDSEPPRSYDWFTLLGTDHTGIDFRNDVRETHYMNGLFYEYYYNGGGVAIADFNQDGLPDIYFVSNLEANKLYLNQGEMTFRDVTLEAGVAGKGGFSTGVTVVDINSDGKLDMYVSRSGKFEDPDMRRNLLYVNQGNNARGVPTFVEQAGEFGLDREELSTQAAFLDYDLDGDLDMFLMNHDVDTYRDDQMEAYLEQPGRLSGERLFRNDDGYFQDATPNAGIVNDHLSYGLGLSIGDLNNDGLPDIYVGHDYAGADHLYLNNGDGTFHECAGELFRHTANFSMGSDMADFNNDGWLDIMTVDMVSEDNYGIKTSMSGMNPKAFFRVVDLGLNYQYMFNALQLNNGVTSPGNKPYFSEIGHLAGISNTDWSWGPLFMDMDLDGHRDLFIGNGIKRDFRNNDFVKFHKDLRARLIAEGNFDEERYINEVLDRMPTRRRANYFFRNRGGLRFEKISGPWTAPLTCSNGAAYADLDLDGDLDIVVNNMDEPAGIYRNNAREQGSGNYLKIALKGSPSNPLGIGARITLRAGDSRQVAEHHLTRGFQSSVAPGLHFGLGSVAKVDSLWVRWPDGKRQTLTGIEANAELELDHANATDAQNPPQSARTLFQTLDPESLGLPLQHRENEFDDFARESLLPHRMSRFGPALAAADVNGDGLDDLFFGGAKQQASSLWMQQASGSFTRAPTRTFHADPAAEDVAARFFDADGDGDMDLYVVRGGNEADRGDASYLDALYVNEKGAFRHVPEALPALAASGSCAVPADYDNDGDIDLFIGGRQSPGAYPYPGRSTLLRNESESASIRFVDATRELAPDLEQIGMVTDAVWADLNADQRPDLVLAGEWMPIKVMIQTDSGFEDATQNWGLDEQTGWWWSVRAADMDADGDLDLIAGNLGLNYKYQASPEAPFEVYADDFDANGSLDIVLGYHNEGGLFPLRGRECSSNQMPFIKEKFPTYDAFGKATLGEVLGEEKLEEALHYQVNTFASTWFENDGKGRFVPHVLPDRAQVSSINTIHIEDFDRDGKMDMLLAGNLYSAEVETPRNDAGYGLFLAGLENGGFQAFEPFKSGILLEGDIRQAALLNRADGNRIMVFGNNNGRPRVVRLPNGELQ